MEKHIGTVTHWYDKLGVAGVRLDETLSVGDRIKIRRGDEEFEDVVSSLQIDHEDADVAWPGEDAAMKISHRAKVKEGAEVLRVED